MSELTGLSIDGRVAKPSDPDWDEARRACWDPDGMIRANHELSLTPA
jgi:hypothetical protein